jgi:hypothetical protein
LSKHFDSIESAQEYVGKLTESLVETKTAIEAELTTLDKRTRRFNGLMTARYHLERLEYHLKRGTTILNHLRRLEHLCK